MFHEQLWSLLVENDTDETINSEFVFVVLRILLDPANLPPEETAAILQGNG